MFNMVRSRSAAHARIYRGGMPSSATNGLSKTSKPEDDEHLKRLEAVGRENARLANEAPITQEQAEEISKRST